ncbi:hypothetical protein [Cytobacillus dafuensis]|nr:hypothetical protein [Cytobacillus dafuensis]
MGDDEKGFDKIKISFDEKIKITSINPKKVEDVYRTIINHTS